MEVGVADSNTTSKQEAALFHQRHFLEPFCPRPHLLYVPSPSRFLSFCAAPLPDPRLLTVHIAGATTLVLLLLCHTTVQMGGEGAVSGEDVVLLQMVQYGIKHGTLQSSCTDDACCACACACVSLYITQRQVR